MKLFAGIATRVALSPKRSARNPKQRGINSPLKTFTFQPQTRAEASAKQPLSRAVGLQHFDGLGFRFGSNFHC